MGMTKPAYVLGHSDRELSRLRVQARLLEPATRQIFREAGIDAGMRVLDIGSGAGDVAFLTAALVRKVARHVRPGGLVIFHEPDWVGARSIPPAPTYERCCGWIRETFRLAGTDSNMAAKLFTTFIRAGLAAPQMRMQTFIGGGAASADFLQALADLIETLIPSMEQLGVATLSEVDVETLVERLMHEATENGSVIVGRAEIGAWARV
jgi:hypothetical protein